MRELTAKEKQIADAAYMNAPEGTDAVCAAVAAVLEAQEIRATDGLAANIRTHKEVDVVRQFIRHNSYNFAEFAIEEFLRVRRERFANHAAIVAAQQQRIDDLEAERDSLQLRMDGCIAINQSAPAEIVELRDHVAALIAENAELKHSVAVFAKGLENEEADSDALHDEIDALTAERDSLQLRMDGAIAINQSAAAEIVELRAQIARLTAVPTSAEIPCGVRISPRRFQDILAARTAPPPSEPQP